MAGSAYLSSPDEISPYYPERFIRPLPKRTIRSRLSAEAADAISYPPNPPSASLPAYSPYDYEHEHDSFQDDDEHDHGCPHSHHHHHHHCHHHDDDDDDDDGDSVEELSPIAQRQSTLNRSSPRASRSQRHGRYNSYGGKSASAPDGYEAFENTNNKKKRKIPTSGSMSIHQNSLHSDFAHMGISSRNDSAEDLGISPNGLGVGGAGRGRTGRKTNPRNPLGPSTNASNVRAGSAKYDAAGSSIPNDGSRTDQGIISKAIATATTLLTSPLGKGQENVGVLDQQAKATPTNSQFTFTCEADAKGVKFPEQSLYSPEYAHRVNSAPATAPSQTQKYAHPATQYAGPTTQSAPSAPPSGTPTPQQTNAKQRPRRRKGDVYTLAARQRKLQQEYTNLQHPPSHDDIWICEFCEYESIFGSPPLALVRQYEIKDRRERKRLAEKRRLLEKAKLKGRKGKKQTKSAAKAATAAAQQPINQQNYNQPPLDQMDEYIDEGYDDDPEPLPAPPPQAPVAPTMPGAYDRGGGGGGAGTGRSSSDSAVGGGGGGGGGTIR